MNNNSNDQYKRETVLTREEGNKIE
jgi:hypothetical protein